MFFNPERQQINDHKRGLIAAFLLISFFVLLVGCGDSNDGAESSEPYQPEFESRSLNISPIAQQTEVWCWAATAEMVFRYFGLPNLNPGNNYQCGIVAAYFGPTSPCWFDCFACTAAIGSMTELQRLINDYGKVANQFIFSKVLTSTLIFSPLTFNGVAREIDNGRPIIAGVSSAGYSYPNIPQHVTVIVGYENNNGVRRLIVNDPFPYDLFFSVPNPYYQAGARLISPGSYSISYSAFISNLYWTDTIYQIN